MRNKKLWFALLLMLVKAENTTMLFYSKKKNEAKSVSKAELRFWRKSSDRKRFFKMEEASRKAGIAPPCPKVFVYDLAPELTDWRPSKATVNRSSEVITVPSVAVDENANLMEVILTRLATSKRCLATDPTEADLFLVPVLPKIKHWQEWGRLCGSSILKGRRFDRELPYLTKENARRHVFVYPRVAYQIKCHNWWTTPMPAILASFARVAVGGCEELIGDFHRDRTVQRQQENPQLIIPRLVSAPYVANVRFSTTTIPITTENDERPFLFMYSGSLHGSNKSIQLRTALQAACDTNPSQCATAKSGSERRRRTTQVELEKRLPSTLKMRNATFCPQPPGDTPGRASMMTALLLGCIPIYFAPEQDRLWPLHIGPWIKDARIFIPADKIIQDSNYFINALTAIPPNRINHMRTAIRRHARRLQYALDDMPDDALEVLLRGLRAAA